MIFGTNSVCFEYEQNTNFSRLVPKLHTTVYDFNIPDILLQKAINGHVIQIIKGYYHKFTVTVYDYDENDEEIMNLATDFYPHYVDSTSQKYKINKISEPFYVAEINGFNAVTFVIETIGYETITPLTILEES